MSRLLLVNEENESRLSLIRHLDSHPRIKRRRLTHANWFDLPEKEVGKFRIMPSLIVSAEELELSVAISFEEASVFQSIAEELQLTQDPPSYSVNKHEVESLIRLKARSLCEKYISEAPYFERGDACRGPSAYGFFYTLQCAEEMSTGWLRHVVNMLLLSGDKL
jgi:hypothetical protein